MSVAAIEEICDELRARGARVTRPLRAVLAALASGDDHLTAADVLDRARGIEPGMQESTVYRTLERLSGWGVVEHVHLVHGALAYHLRPEPHGHLECEACGAVVDVPVGLLGPLAARLERDHDFVLRTGHVALSGWCAACRPQGSSSNAGSSA